MVSAGYGPTLIDGVKALRRLAVDVFFKQSRCALTIQYPLPVLSESIFDAMESQNG